MEIKIIIVIEIDDILYSLYCYLYNNRCDFKINKVIDSFVDGIMSWYKIEKI